MARGQPERQHRMRVGAGVPQVLGLTERAPRCLVLPVIFEADF